MRERYLSGFLGSFRPERGTQYVMDQEQDLAEAFRSGRRGSFELVVEVHVDSLYRFLVNLTMRREDAEDLCQETFLEADRSIRSFRGDSSFKTWLFQIGYRRYLKWRKKCPRTMLLDAEATVESGAQHIEDKLDIRRAMAELSEEQRAVFVLAQVEQFDLVEVSTMIGIPLGTVKSRLSRAKAALRLALDDPLDTRKDYENYEPRGLCNTNPK